MGLLAYLVAGAIVAGLVWWLRHGPGYPRLATLIVFGLVGGGVGGLAANLLQGESIDHLDAIGFTTAAVVALALVVGVQVRVHRAED